MAVEIEKKFLVKDNRWKDNAQAKEYCQGYLSSGSGATVRARIAGEDGFLTIKSEHKGISRLEYEYSIPLNDAMEILEKICPKPLIHKKRYRLVYDNNLWEVDEFSGENEGLVLAEIELTSEDQSFTKPPWLGQEVSQFKRYYNASLRIYPYSKWTEAEKNML